MAPDPDTKIPWERPEAGVQYLYAGYYNDGATSGYVPWQSTPYISANSSTDAHSGSGPLGGYAYVSNMHWVWVFPYMMYITGIHMHGTSASNAYIYGSQTIPSGTFNPAALTGTLAQRTSVLTMLAPGVTYTTPVMFDAPALLKTVIIGIDPQFTDVWFYGVPATPTGLTVTRDVGGRPDGMTCDFGTLQPGTFKTLRFRVCNTRSTAARNVVCSLGSSPDVSAGWRNGFVMSIDEGTTWSPPPLNIGTVHPGPDRRVLLVRAQNEKPVTQQAFSVRAKARASSWD